MNNSVALSVAVVAGVLGFGLGVVTNEMRGPPIDVRLEDRAVIGLIEQLAVAHYLDRGDHTELRKLADSSIYGNLKNLSPQLLGNAELDEAKVRTLNGVANLWKRNPPFKDVEWRTSPNKYEWAEEWEAGMSSNMALLAWAQSICQSQPQYECAKPR